MSLAIPATVLTVVGLTEASQVLNGKPPTMKPVVAGFILGIALYGIGELNTQLATAFGALFVVSALLDHGPAVLSALEGSKSK